MAERLSQSRFVGIELPRAFSAKVRDSLLAAPESVRLREKSPYFYEVGLRLAALCRTEDARQLPAIIQMTLATRVAVILTRSLHSERTDTNSFLEPLTNLEKSLFWTGYKHAEDKMAWLKRHTDRLQKGILN